MANLYFDESIETARVGDIISVTGDEGRHAVRVSRLRVGETTLIGNGRGLIATATVKTTTRDSFAAHVDSVTEVPAPARRLVLVQALAKGDRDERAVEQATEFGVDAIIPWQAARSVSRWNADKEAKGIEKWSRIAREAAKQSMRGWIPEVQPLQALEEIAALGSATTGTAPAGPAAHVIALHPRNAGRLTEAEVAGDRDIYLIVGPEGGFTEEELDTVEAAGGSVQVLGDTVLRTSSAGPAALAVLNAKLGRW